MNQLISIFIHRPITTLMMLAIFVFLGLVSVSKLHLDLFPNVHLPTLTIETEYENASADEVEKKITKPLEEELSTLKNLYYIQAISEEGVSHIHLIFRWNAATGSVDFSALEAREKIDHVKHKLPSKAKDPKVERHHPNAAPILILSISEKNKDASQLRHIAQEKLKPALERVLGVAHIDIFGGIEEEISVKTNAQALEAQKITVDHLIQALKSQNIQAKGGTLREGVKDIAIKTSGQFQSLEDIQNTVVHIHDKKLIRLRDVANVQTIAKTQLNDAYINGRPAVSLAIFKEAAGNTLSISKEIQKLKTEFQQHQHIEMTSSYDQALIIQESLSLVKDNAWIGALLTIMVLLIFLRKISTTFILLLAIPFSVISSFTLFYLFGLSLNIFSLAGIALALGMSVDASIVILENIFVHLGLEERPKTAALNATLEVSGAVIASTLTTLAVFVPILFVQGPIGLIFKDLSLAIIFGQIFSLIISFSFIPMFSAKILRVSHVPERFEQKVHKWKDIVLFGLKLLDKIATLGSRLALLYEKLLKRFMLTPQKVLNTFIAKGKEGEETLEGIQKKIEEKYERTLKEAVQSWQSRVSIVVIIFLIFLFSLAWMPEKEFFPESLQTDYQIELIYPQATTLDHIRTQALFVDQKIRSFKNIHATHLTIEKQKLQFYIKFKSPRKATRSLKQLRAYLKTVPDTYFSVAALNPLSAIAQGLDAKTLDLKVKGPEFQKLKKESQKVAQKLLENKKVTSVKPAFDQSVPEWVVNIHTLEASDFGLTAQDVADQLKEKLYGTEATTFRTPAQDLPIVVSTHHQKIKTHQDLENLELLTPFSSFVPLNAIAHFKEVFSPAALTREEKERTITLFTTLDPKASMTSLTKDLKKISLPAGYSLQLGPNYKIFQSSYASLKVALVLAIVLMYLIMAAQFESLTHPLTILCSVPLTLIGITLSLTFSGKLLSIPAFIGIIILTGIAVNNAIILIDYINILRRRGMDREEAIMVSGKRRLRPILMTSLTTIIGMIPMAFGFGSGAELYQPLAIVLVGGMVSSTVLTLLFIPTIYCFFDDLGDILGFGILKFQMWLTPKNLAVVLILIPMIYGGCTSTPRPEVKEKTTSSSKIDKAYFEQSWKALLQTVKAYPLKDLSREDGTITSGWVYETEHKRYRFFVHLDQNDFLVEPHLEPPLVEEPLESEEHYATAQQRYRFLNETPQTRNEIEPTIDVHYQTFNAEFNQWREEAPPLQYALSLMQTFQKNLHAIRTP